MVAKYLAFDLISRAEPHLLIPTDGHLRQKKPLARRAARDPVWWYGWDAVVRWEVRQSRGRAVTWSLR